MREYQILGDLVATELANHAKDENYLAFILIDTIAETFVIVDYDQTFLLMSAIADPKFYPCACVNRKTLSWLSCCGQLLLLADLFRSLPNFAPAARYFITLNSIIQALKSSPEETEN